MLVLIARLILLLSGQVWTCQANELPVVVVFFFWMDHPKEKANVAEVFLCLDLISKVFFW